jgi:hypothetical protein
MVYSDPAVNFFCFAFSFFLFLKKNLLHFLFLFLNCLHFFFFIFHFFWFFLNWLFLLLQKTVCKKTQAVFSERFQTVQKNRSLIQVMDGLGQTVWNCERFGPNYPELILDSLGKPSKIISRRFGTKLSKFCIFFFLLSGFIYFFFCRDLFIFFSVGIYLFLTFFFLSGFVYLSRFIFLAKSSRKNAAGSIDDGEDDQIYPKTPKSTPRSTPKSNPATQIQSKP